VAVTESAQRVRAPSGGRKPLTTEDPTLVHDLEALVEPTIRCDPSRPCGGPATRSGRAPQTVGAILARASQLWQRRREATEEGGQSMYAIVRRNTYDEAKLARDRQKLDEFDRLHAQQPGFRGHLSIDAGDGSTIVVNVWESEAHALAGLEVLRSTVPRLVEPLLASESELIAAGPVVANDLLPR
jgi:hypothetical protein